MFLKTLIFSVFLFSAGCSTLTEEERFDREYADNERMIIEYENMAACRKKGGTITIFRSGSSRMNGPLGRFDTWSCSKW